MLDTVSIIVIAVAAGIISLALLYLVRRRRQFSYDDDCQATLDEELTNRLHSLNFKVQATLSKVIEASFPPLDRHTEDDQNEKVKELIQAIEKRVMMAPDDYTAERRDDTTTPGGDGDDADRFVPDAATLHMRLSADRAVFDYCADKVSVAYEEIHRIVIEEENRVFAKECETDLPAPKTGSCYSLVGIFRSWEKSHFRKARQVFYYVLGHRLCCGRHRIQPRRDPNAAAVEMEEDENNEKEDEERDSVVLTALGGVSLTKYLHTGACLKRQYIEVTQHAKELIAVDQSGEVQVLPTAHMYSRRESERLLKQVFQCADDDMVFSPREERNDDGEEETTSPRLPLFDESDEAKYFSLGGVREDLATLFFNIHRVIFTSNRGEKSALIAHHLVTEFDKQVKHWALSVLAKAINNSLHRWKDAMIFKCANILRGEYALIAQQQSATSPGRVSENSPRIVFPDKEALMVEFWKQQSADLIAAIRRGDPASVPADSLHRCCGYCMPQSVEFEAGYAGDLTAVSKSLIRKLRSKIVSAILAEDERLLARKDLVETKVKLMNILIPPRDEPADEVAFETVNVQVDREASSEQDVPVPQANVPSASCKSLLVDTAIRECFGEVERLLDHSLSHHEEDIAEKYLRLNRPFLIEELKKYANALAEEFKTDFQMFAAQVVVMRRCYAGSRGLCAAGRRLHLVGESTEGVATVLDKLRDALIEAKELTKVMSHAKNSNAPNVMCMLKEGSALNSTTGKPQTVFPWNNIYVTYNFFAELLQKPKITLQFIFERTA